MGEETVDVDEINRKQGEYRISKTFRGCSGGEGLKLEKESNVAVLQKRGGRDTCPAPEGSQTLLSWNLV